MEEKPVTKKHKCDEDGCEKSFSRPWRLEAHKCWHRGERAFVCKEVNCGKSFVMKQHLGRHIAKSHPGSSVESEDSEASSNCKPSSSRRKKAKAKDKDSGKSFQCNDCSKNFSKHQQLKIHEYEHTGIKPFSCEVCQKSFLLPSRLKRHQKTHSGYECGHEGCSDVFQFWSELTAHRRAMHRRSYTCDTCGKAFKSKGNLRGHVQVHSEERQAYVCSFEGCDKSYLRMMELRLHMSRIHEGVRDVCPFEGCGKTFSCKARLRRHARIHDPKYEPKPRAPRSYKNKRPRVDKGMKKPPKKSMLSLLTGLNLSYKDNQKLLQGQQVEFSLDAVSISESDTDRSL